MQVLKDVGLNDEMFIGGDDYVRYIYQVMINHIRYCNQPFDHEDSYTYFYCEELDDFLGMRVYAKFIGGYKISFDIHFGFDKAPLSGAVMYIYYINAEGVHNDGNNHYLKFNLSQFGCAVDANEYGLNSNDPEFNVSSVEGCNDMLLHLLFNSPFFYFKHVLPYPH